MKQTPKIIKIGSKKLVGQSVEMSLTNNKTLELFSSFMPLKREIQNAINTYVFEVLIYDAEYLKTFSPTNTFTKWATVEVENYDAIPQNMQTLDLDGGLYAIFNYKGLAKDFGDFMFNIYTNYLPKSEYQIDNRPHFNVLGEKTQRNSVDSEEVVWIPIKHK